MNINLSSWLMGLALWVILSTPLFSQSTTPKGFEDFDNYIKARMQEWNIPGAALAIIRNDSVILVKGFGVQNIATKELVNEKTLFSIGSITKGFTATATVILALEEKVALDAPISEQLPGFKLNNEALTKQVSVRDLLAHRTGLERGDYIFFGAGYTRQDIMNRLYALKPLTGLREHFIYNNLMYTAVGMLIEHKSGISYEQYISQKLFNPLGMSRTTFSVSLTANSSNIAFPHSEVNGNLTLSGINNMGGVEPAGGIWSNAEDMAQWLRFNTGRGKVDDQEILASPGFRELRTPVIFTGGGIRFDETYYKSYGLGWSQTAYKGEVVQQHTGASGGYSSHIAYLPAQKSGVVLLTNTDTYTYSIIYNVLDRLLEKEQSDWNSEVLAMYQEQKAAESEQSKQPAREALKLSNKEKEALTGKFAHEVAQNIEVVMDKSKKLVLLYAGRTFELYQYEANKLSTAPDSMLGVIELEYGNDTSKDGKTSLRMKLMGEDLAYTKK